MQSILSTLYLLSIPFLLLNPVTFVIKDLLQKIYSKIEQKPIIRFGQDLFNKQKINLNLTQLKLLFLFQNSRVQISITGRVHCILFRNASTFQLNKINFFFLSITLNKQLILFQFINSLKNKQINFQIYNNFFNYITQLKIIYKKIYNLKNIESKFQLNTNKNYKQQHHCPQIHKSLLGFLSQYNMNKQQAVKQKLTVEKYLENNKLRPLFYQLTKTLTLNKPEDPIQYLINYLEKRNKKQVICIHGYHDQQRVKLAKNISNKFNYKVIELQQIFKGASDWHSKKDKQINQKVLAQLNKVQTMYKGIILSGYPNNIVQTDFIQKSGILPQRYFIMQNNEQQIKKLYEQKYSGGIDKILERNKIQIKQLEQILGDQIDHLPSDKQKSTEKIIQTLSIKANRSKMPYDSLRILIIHPPYLKPQNSSVFVDTYSLNPISINQTLKKFSNKQGFITNVQSYIRKHKSISKQIELAMIQTVSKNATSKNKGFALYGWPQHKDRIPLLKQHFLNPHLILVFDANKQKALQCFVQLNADDSNVFSITKKPSNQQYQKLYHDYVLMVEQLKGKNNVHVFQHDESTQKINKTFLSLIENPKIYS